MEQLNVYAHIWQKLRGQKLDEMAVIATRPTENLHKALNRLTNEFPNPKRIGCPPLEALERNAKDPIHPDASLAGGPLVGLGWPTHRVHVWVLGFRFRISVFLS